MKNIIKRGTSLLLVLAMLLSFAAVVGAEEPTTTTSEKILTLTVEDAVVKAGETTYIPAYVQGSTDNIIMSMNLSAISENSAVQITGVYPAKPLRWDGDDWEYDESTKGVLTLSGATAAAPETKNRCWHGRSQKRRMALQPLRRSSCFAISKFWQRKPQRRRSVCVRSRVLRRACLRHMSKVHM